MSTLVRSIAVEAKIPVPSVVYDVLILNATPLLTRKRVLITAIVSWLLQFINLGSVTAFQDLTSITVAGLYCSHLITTALLLWRRCTGGIIVRGENKSDKSSSDTWKSESSLEFDSSPKTEQRILTNTHDASPTRGPVSSLRSQT